MSKRRLASTIIKKEEGEEVLPPKRQHKGSNSTSTTIAPAVKVEAGACVKEESNPPATTTSYFSTPKKEPESALKVHDDLSTITAQEPSPYPTLKRPTPSECLRARDALAALHGPPEREVLEECGTVLEKKHPGKSILDSLVRTILSQNTTDKLSSQAFASFKAKCPTYKAMLEAPVAEVEESIRIGGLAAIKVGRIRTILETILKERPKDCINGEPSLEYIWDMDTEAIKAELSRFKGVGPKTISCVLMFTMQRHEFPVDTHVWHIAKKLGWVPNTASREQAYLHLNARVPDCIKYDLHVLLVRHGKKCKNCAKGGRLIQPSDGPCPLSGVNKGQEGKVKAEKSC